MLRLSIKSFCTASLLLVSAQLIYQMVQYALNGGLSGSWVTAITQSAFMLFTAVLVVHLNIALLRMIWRTR